MSSDAFGAEIAYAMSNGVSLTLAHEMPGIGGQEARGGAPFSSFFAACATPIELLKAGIYSKLAVPFKGGAWREASSKHAPRGTWERGVAILCTSQLTSPPDVAVVMMGLTLLPAPKRGPLTQVKTSTSLDPLALSTRRSTSRRNWSTLSKNLPRAVEEERTIVNPGFLVKSRRLSKLSSDQFDDDLSPQDAADRGHPRTANEIQELRLSMGHAEPSKDRPPSKSICCWFQIRATDFSRCTFTDRSIVPCGSGHAQWHG